MPEKQVISDPCHPEQRHQQPVTLPSYFLMAALIGSGSVNFQSLELILAVHPPSPSLPEGLSQTIPVIRSCIRPLAFERCLPHSARNSMTNPTTRENVAVSSADPMIDRDGKLDVAKLRAALGDAVAGEGEGYKFSWEGRPMPRKSSALRPVRLCCQRRKSRSTSTRQKIFTSRATTSKCSSCFTNPMPGG